MSKLVKGSHMLFIAQENTLRYDFNGGEKALHSNGCNDSDYLRHGYPNDDAVLPSHKKSRDRSANIKE